MILAKLKEICKESLYGSNIDIEHILPQDRMLEDLGFTSITLLILAIGIEEEFKIRLDTNKALKCVYVSDIIALIEEELNHE